MIVVVCVAERKREAKKGSFLGERERVRRER